MHRDTRHDDSAVFPASVRSRPRHPSQAQTTLWAPNKAHQMAPEHTLTPYACPTDPDRSVYTPCMHRDTRHDDSAIFPASVKSRRIRGRSVHGGAVAPYGCPIYASKSTTHPLCTRPMYESSDVCIVRRQPDTQKAQDESVPRYSSTHRKEKRNWCPPLKTLV